MRKPVIVLIAVCWCIALWIFFRPSQGTSPVPAGRGSAGFDARQTGPIGTNPTAGLEDRIRALYKQAQSQVDPLADWKVPIRFFGKVVHEKGSPVPDVHVHLEVMHFNGTSDYSVQTDSKGQFTFAGVKGKSLGVRLEKANFYPFRGPGNEFELGDPYNRNLRFYTPDPSSPVVFRMRSKGRAEVLVHWEKQFQVREDEPIRIDLRTGRTNSTGDLLLEPLRNVPDRSGVTQGEWAMRVTALTGGVLLHTDEYPFDAPADGYQSPIELDERTPKPAGSRVGNGYDGGALFVKTGTNYARIELTMGRGNPYCDIECFLNPNGSRKLEFDPAIQPETKAFYQPTRR